MFVVEKKPKSIAAESYKTLRTNIQYSSIDDKYKMIVVTSAEPGEGKSTTSGNLALVLAQDGKKVLLIDCDMRKPSIHRSFNISNAVGLSDFIVNKITIEEVVFKFNDNLTIIPAGNIPPNPSEILDSAAMRKFLQEMRDVFDYIVIDTPPLQAVTDAQILSAKADGTLLVVKAEKTKRDSVRNAVNLIQKVNGTIIGTVLNSVDKRATKYYYYYEEEKTKTRWFKKKKRKKVKVVDNNSVTA